MSHMTEQKKGIVLETQPNLITVLTPQGEFRSVPWAKPPYPEVGSEINFRETAEQKSLFSFNRLMAIAACLLIVFFSVSLWSGIILPSRQVVAYVNIDINPSIELGLNEKGKVVQATGLNQDGQLLLENLKLEKLAADKAVELITQAAMDQNYLREGNENAVVITVSDPDKVPEKVKKLDEKVKEQLAAKQLSGTTQVLEVNGQLHDKAKELGVSPGKYVILLEAVEEGLELSVEDLKGNSIVKAIKAAGGVPGQVISRAKHDQKGYQELESRVADKIKKITEDRKHNEKRPREEKPQLSKAEAKHDKGQADDSDLTVDGTAKTEKDPDRKENDGKDTDDSKNNNNKAVDPHKAGDSKDNDGKADEGGKKKSSPESGN